MMAPVMGDFECFGFGLAMLSTVKCGFWAGVEEVKEAETETLEELGNK